MKKPILPSEIEIAFHRSHFLLGWCLFFSTAVLLSIWCCLPWPWSAGLIMGYLLACVWQYGQWLSTGWRYSVHSLNVDVYGQMHLMSRCGQLWPVSVLSDSVVHPWCIALHLRYHIQDDPASEGSVRWPWLRPRYLLILPDHADRTSLRALRVWLRWGLRE